MVNECGIVKVYIDGEPFNTDDYKQNVVNSKNGGIEMIEFMKDDISYMFNLKKHYAWIVKSGKPPWFKRRWFTKIYLVIDADNVGEIKWKMV